MAEGLGRDAKTLAVAGVCGIAAGMFGVGGGALLVPLLGLFLGYTQHRAQGTSLVALIPPTGILALLSYAKEGYVSWKTGLLLIPGLFLGGVAGGIMAKRIKPERMRQVFAALVFVLSALEALLAR